MTSTRTAALPLMSLLVVWQSVCTKRKEPLLFYHFPKRASLGLLHISMSVPIAVVSQILTKESKKSPILPYGYPLRPQAMSVQTAWMPKKAPKWEGEVGIVGCQATRSRLTRKRGRSGNQRESRMEMFAAVEWWDEQVGFLR